MKENNVCVLLSTYNGEKYLETQLDSLLKQEGVNLSVFVRDDGSTDKTVEIITEYKNKYSNIYFEKGSNVGFVQSFWTLLLNSKGFDYYAFCDQDDYWKPEKLVSAIKMLDKNIPMLYTSNVVSVNNDFEVLKEKGFPFEGVLSYADSLQRPVLPGCTFVWNDLLHQELKKYHGPHVAHDWSVYKIASAIGEVVYDENSYILYRIHGNNTIGIDSLFTRIKKKMNRFITDQYKNVKSDTAKAILDTYSLSNEKRQVTNYFANYRKYPSYFFKLMRYKEYRNLNFIFLLLTRKV